jgi:DNA recombination protein RmuC
MQRQRRQAAFERALRQLEQQLQALQQQQAAQESELRHARERHAETQRQLQQASEVLERERGQHAAARSERDGAQAWLQQLRPQLDERERQQRHLQQENGELRARLAAQESAMAESRRAAQEKLELLQQARTQLTQEFQALAGRIFDEKSERFAKQSQGALEGTLNPLKEQLNQFRQRVETVYDSENKDRSQLRAELSQLKELNRRMSEEALNLTRALKGENKTAGNWGEVILERVLEESGLRKGHEYDTQFAARDDSGRRRHPDVVVRLPDNKDIIIDAKVSLVDYERYCSAAEEGERGIAIRAHVASLRAHIEGLSVKEYESLDGIRSLDFVLIFVPIEAAFLAAFEHDPALFRLAYDRNIIVVSPTTLLATLRTVQTIWRYERQNANAEAIAGRAGRLHDQFALVLESLQELGRQLERSRDAYDKTVDRFSRGRGNLVRQVDDLARLGARTKRRLPAAFADDSEGDEAALPAADDEPDTESPAQ